MQSYPLHSPIFFKLTIRTAYGRLGVIARGGPVNFLRLDFPILVGLVEEGDQLGLAKIRAELNARSVEPLHASRAWNLPRIHPMRLDVAGSGLGRLGETLLRTSI